MKDVTLAQDHKSNPGLFALGYRGWGLAKGGKMCSLGDQTGGVRPAQESLGVA